MKTLTIELPLELLQLLGSEEEAKKEAKLALILEMIRKGTVSRAKAAELLGIPLADFPTMLTQYHIPWFDETPEQLEQDLRTLRARETSTR